MNAVRLVLAAALVIIFWEMSGDPLRSGWELLLLWAVIAGIVALAIETARDALLGDLDNRD